MMSSNSMQNVQQSGPLSHSSSYLQTASESLDIQPDRCSSVPTPPVRDASSLKSIKYGPGHEKFPSWPVAAAAEQPQILRGPPSGGSHRSKSWTDHTNYPKEKVITYTRPFMKRPNSQQKLTTVMERSEKLSTKTDETTKIQSVYLPRVDREGKSLGDLDYMVPSPPERDRTTDYQIPQLTQADLEEYTRSYEEALHHQKQPSYAQSEGYHSYVSSTDSMSTPFLDRLRRDSEARNQNTSLSLPIQEWEIPERESKGRDSVVTTSSGSGASSSETLKWHGSMSDVSVASSSHNSPTSKQLIAHSARVQTPQRHNSESVLYIVPGSENAKKGDQGWKEREIRNNQQNKLRLFPVNTYTVQPDNRLETPSQTAPLSVADRISELERTSKYRYLDPDKKHRVSDPTLKAIQKKALLSFYERHHTPNKQTWRSEPQLAQPLKTKSPPPQPPPRPNLPQVSRRASSASDYAKLPKHQHSNSCGSLSNDLVGPIIVGPSISIDDWVPERPPKNPHLREVFPDLYNRVPSPDLPPPSPPIVLETEIDNDEPFPPPPPECLTPKLRNSISFDERTQHRSSFVRYDSVGFATHRQIPTERTSMRMRQQGQFRAEPLRGQQKPAPQVPKQPSFRPRTQSVTDGYVIAPPLKPRTSKAYQSMRLSTSRGYSVPVNDDMGLTRYSMSGAFPVKEMSSDGRKSTTSLSPSNSKASYLSYRRDRERGQPDADYGSYKRIISPPSGNNLDTLDRSENEKWASTNNLTKETIINNNNLLHRLSLGNADIKPKRACNLPDVLPVSAKMSPPRSLRIDRPECPTPSPEHSPRLHPPPKLSTPPPPKTPVTSPPHTPPVEKRASICLERPFTNNRLSLVETREVKSTTEVSTMTRDLAKSRQVVSPPPNVVEGLQLIQRTEVVLRINACTTDAASQTDRESESPVSVVRTPLPIRRKLKEEIECDQLSRDLASQLSPSDKLKGILVPAVELKKPTDYVSGLFKLEVTSRPRSNNAGSFNHFEKCNISTQFSTEDLSRSSEPSSPLSATSTYFTTSEPKAKFLTRYSRDMTHYNGVVQDTKDLNQKKEELMNRLDRKLDVLRNEHLVVNEESRVNDALGEQVSSHVTRLARPQEVTKYRLHVEEVGKITSLLLGLSGRLARAENALMGLAKDHPERNILESKRDKLQEQLEEAKKLKENIDKRSVNVSNILYKYLNPEEYGDYDHFINMKAKLIMDAREIADKIKLGEEQLAALRETLTTTDIR